MRVLLFFTTIFINQTILNAQINVVSIQNRVEITWNYSGCNSIGNFVIEKSKNGTHFREFLNVPNNKNYCTYYSETDLNPYENISFYRIRYVNYNGNYFYSEIVSVKNPSVTNQLSKKLIGYNSINVLVILKEKSNGEFYSKLNIQESNGELVCETLNENIKSGKFIIIASENDALVGNSLKITNRNPID